MATIDKNVFKKAFRATTHPLRMLPHFMIIGTQKGGTTSLYQYLIEHPCIAPIWIKEPHFFDIYFYKGVHWYRSHFPTTVEQYYARHIQKHDLITGEASPYYLFHPQAAQRVAKTLPRAKFILLLRNPVDRAYSQYQHQTRQEGVEPLSFEEALASEEQRLAGEEEKILRDEKYFSFNHRHYSYLARSKYIEQLPAWMDVFPREQFLILRSEDLYTDPKAIVKQTLDFLGLPSSYLKQEYKPFNDAKYAKMAPATRERLLAYFKPYNDRLYDYLGRDFGWDN
ncbi:MAG TPA: sulfotransferase domain-containing protein [Ktedonobacteraceae bacterium]|nr:sulfotransferase domain-containing protein [Ktedonobacteraceae bacterium]